MADEITSGSPAVEAEVTETPAAGSSTLDAFGASAPKANSEPTVDRSVLEARVAESLKSIREIDEPVTAPDDGAEIEAEPEVSETPQESNEAPETEESSQDKPTDEPEQPAKAKPSGPTLPGHLVRSLKAYGWSDEDIAAGFNADPSRFTVTAQLIHKNRNDETSRWAETGRATRANQAQNAPQDAENSPHIDPKTGSFKLLDAGAMAEELGANEDVINKFISPINAVLTRINSVLPDLMSGIHTVQRTKTDQLVRQVDAFFSSPDLASYADSYGKDFASLTEGQIETRNKVLETADALVSGAKQQGRQLSVTDALMIAHDHVSAGLKAKTIRTEIARSVQKRSAGITVRPTTGSTSGTTAGPAKTKSEMEARTTARLAKVFGNS